MDAFRALDEGMSCMMHAVLGYDRKTAQ